MRADALLFASGLAESRSKAQQMIREGCVYAGGKQIKKPAVELPEDTLLSVVRMTEHFVGRGGLKLLAALSDFGVDPAGMRCLDVGASTGGFTDCLLKRGAAAVTAVDCGRDQLASSLRADGRVRSIEGLNARYMTREEVGDGYDLAVMDLSFISLTYVLPAVPPLLAEDGRIIALIKPQFELDAKSVSKGVVRGSEKRLRALERVYDFLPGIGLTPLAFSVSPIKGGDGNTEYLCCLKKTREGGEPAFRREALRELARA
ncbi:MAG: TlyA family RNA methyltransferase [Clostridia bacterium]|nr:TlyA family RNA methyltransferase [Clostridia bacterium]